MRVEPVAGDDPRDVLRALRAALNGTGPAAGLGMTQPAEVPAGTALVVATSGSTGIPKQVVLSRNALVSSALATAARIGEGAWLLALPAGYIAGAQVLVRALIQGREPALLGGRFSPASFSAAASLMASSRGGTPVPAYTSLVPAQLVTLLDAGAADTLSSFAAVLVGGQRIENGLRERAQDAGIRIVRTYGSSETSGGCVYDGVPLDGVEVRSRSGELEVTGPVLADGYLGDPAGTDSVFVRDPDGRRWYRTGDAGRLDEGVVTVTGRRDAVIVSGGINVSLDRVEQAVRGIPGLDDAVVVGVPDDRWGEASVIVTCGSAELETVRRVVAESIGAAARPSRIVRVERMPVLPSGKPDRQALRRMLG